MTTSAHTFTGQFVTDTHMSARCSCGAKLRAHTGGQSVATPPVPARWARQWFANHLHREGLS